MEQPRTNVTRRQLLVGGAASLVLVACSDDGGADRDTADPSTTNPTGGDGSTTAGPEPDGASLAAFTAADFAPLGTCVLLPEATAGPFPLDEQFDRRDVTEGRPGHPMRLGLRVVDQSCAPVAGAAVEIWHADATGDYSAFADGGGGKDDAEGTTFLRGTQTAGDDGIVEFHSIYPGWYTGRAVHIHLRVHVDGDVVRTSQLYFDETVTAEVLATGPYAEFGEPDTTNGSDGLAGDPADEGTLLVPDAGATAAGPGTVALLNLGIVP